MYHEGVHCIELSLSKITTFTPKSVVISDMNYDCLKEIKNYYSHIVTQVLT